ncbi:MAG: oxidoreductase [Bacteroidetes bacterium]|nr:MAG: oxidoreductase [Bacteroidota bacterium]
MNSSSKPVKTALASFGMSGLVFHGPLLHADNCFELTKVLERTKNESVKKYPNIQVVRHFDELCKDDSIELIIVNTPDHTHYELCKKALEHNKHVVVEKPFTQKYSEAIELIELAEQRNLLLSVFQNRRWDGDFLTVKKVISEKLLGRLVSYEAHFDRFRNFIQPETWKEDAYTGTGTLFNLGSHLIDQALVLFGKPDAVTADIRALRSNSSIDDTFELWLHYPQVRVSLSASYLVREPGPRFELHGTEGSFLKWGIDPQEEELKKDAVPGSIGWGEEPESEFGLLHTTLDGKDIKERIATIPGDYTAFYNNIYRAIRRGEKLAVEPGEAAMVIKIIEAAFLSQNEKRQIKI